MTGETEIVGVKIFDAANVVVVALGVDGSDVGWDHFYGNCRRERGGGGDVQDGGQRDMYIRSERDIEREKLFG